MRKIRVIQLIEDLELGGIERNISTIYDNLDRDKYEIEVWCIAKGGLLADDLIRKKAKIRILNIKSYYNPFNILKFSYELAKAKPDIIHTHGYFANTLGRISAILIRVPVILTHLHSTYTYYSRRNFLIERFLSKFTDKIICCSEAAKQFALDYEKIDPEKLVTIYYGIDIAKFTTGINPVKIRQEFGILPGEILVGTVGRFHPVKGYEFLLEAAGLVIKEFPNAKFMIVGEGPLRHSFEKMVKRLGIERKVIFTGLRRDISEILSAMDIFVLSSILEGLAISILEAMACGLAVVSTKVGGVPEIVEDGVTGSLVPARDSNSLAEAILNLIKDSTKRSQMGEIARQRVLNSFSKEAMICKIEELYDYFVDKKIKPHDREN